MTGRTLCTSCLQANVSCPVYPMDTLKCVEYRADQINCFDTCPFTPQRDTTACKHFFYCKLHWGEHESLFC